MKHLLTQQDFQELRAEVATWPGITLNVAFLQDIKQDSQKPEEIIGELQKLLSMPEQLHPSRLVFLLSRLRDELETYFALEEFYGYFRSANLTHSRISVRAARLCVQHEDIYLELCELIDLAEAALYRERPIEQAMTAIVAGFRSFVQAFSSHEQEERDLMMRLCNDDIGVGG